MTLPKEIIDYLKKFNQNDNSIYGFFGGNLALINYGVNNNNEILLKIGLKRIKESISSLSIARNKHQSYSNGFISSGIIADYLVRKDLIDTDNDFFNLIDKIAFTYGQNYLKAKNFDFISGSTGIGFYFEKRIKENKLATLFIENWISDVNKNVKNDNISIYDIYLSKKESKIINCGLAHGLPAILKLSIKLLYHLPNDERLKNIIDSIVKFLLSIKCNSNSLYYFPHTINPEHINTKADLFSRLAWCYGDLSLCYILLQTAKVIDDDYLYKYSIEIIKKITSRRTQNETGIVDAGLCHGSSGVAHIFNRIHKLTGITLLKESVEFWLKKTLEFSVNGQGTVGYRIPNISNKKHEIGLLNGIAGISLCLQTYLYSNFDWDFSLILD